ncbi:unnamed protein product [Moneuplotes crassus]|uniref:Calpain catalytic domain-containing protein n=1 Tax=Euplotes crassus TaxID=5936 RepID=A0AAD2D8I9_EUPCR|nr:unnamed protein product [Moneuplotes crassus]
MEKISETERNLEGVRAPNLKKALKANTQRRFCKNQSIFLKSVSLCAERVLCIGCDYGNAERQFFLYNLSSIRKGIQLMFIGMDCSKYKEVLSKMIEKARDLFQFDPLDNMDQKNAQNRVKSRIASGCDSYEIVSTGTELAGQVREGLCSFIDSDFPPQDSSISPSASRQPKGIVWLRAHEFMEETPNLFKDEIKFEDVKMGCLAICYFLSSVGQLTNNPDFIKNELFVTQEYNNEGIYILRFFWDGEHKKVIVDNYFPCRFSEKNKFEPIYAQNNSSELWVMLLEKAFAKLNGYYDALNEGYLSHHLTDLTGAPVEQIKIKKDFEDTKAAEQYYSGLLESLNQKRAKRYLIFSSTPSRDDNEFLEVIVQSRHAFAISLTPDGFVIVYDPSGIGATSALSESSLYREKKNKYALDPDEETKMASREAIEQGFKIQFWCGKLNKGQNCCFCCEFNHIVICRIGTHSVTRRFKS